jgi:hypothetical protein
MSEYPWGPHGPRLEGPPSVTPNPTPSWVEPSAPASDPYSSYQPSSQSSSSGGGYAQSSYSAGSVYLGGGGPPPRKSFWLAIPLAWFLGPVGLLYSIGDSKPQLIALAGFVGTAAWLHFSSFQPPVQLFHPILMTCAVWSVFAVLAYNRRHKND